MSNDNETLVRLEGIKAAMTCEDCGGPRAIGEAGLVCLAGCGRIIGFGLAVKLYGLARLVRERWDDGEALDRAEVAAEAAALLRKAYPAQVIGGKQTMGESPAAQGTRGASTRRRTRTREEWDKLEQQWRERNGQ